MLQYTALYSNILSERPAWALHHPILPAWDNSQQELMLFDGYSKGPNPESNL